MKSNSTTETVYETPTIDVFDTQISRVVCTSGNGSYEDLNDGQFSWK